MEVVTLLILVVFITFALYSIYEIILLQNATRCVKENECCVDQRNEARRTLVYILLIATFAYGYISSIPCETIMTRSIRYLDWAITTPLLTYSYYLIGKINGIHVSLANLLVTNLLFIAMGIIAEYYLNVGDTNKALIFTILSFLFFAFFLYNIYQLTCCLYKKGVNTQGLEYFFYLGWTLYGVVFLFDVIQWMNRDFVIGAYTLLDFFNKVVYSAVATSVISSSCK